MHESSEIEADMETRIMKNYNAVTKENVNQFNQYIIKTMPISILEVTV